MRFFTAFPFLYALASLGLASPVPEAVTGTGPAPDSDTIFKYCTEEKLTGSCNRDDDDSLNHCETSSFKVIESLKVYEGYKCTIYMASGCSGDSRTYTKGEVPTLPAMYMNFKSYKCVDA
ncbi:hypothetical protein PG994_008141 [Apiospora phragmitis]|uniref:Uncharacterized protein n=1 Tax=Apiospora phragmitis TaxID=2905665 RepID=A0ABR1UUP5_9PEZI